jgi:hypothetical protein
MYWSAAFWTMGRTVVDPLILIVCFSPEITGAAVAAGIAAVAAGVPDGIAKTDDAVGDATGAAVAAGEAVATGVVVPFPVQPATSASIRTAARHSVIFMNAFHFELMVVITTSTPGIKRFFAINYTSIYT